ncbi:MAG: hypothetical protein EON93_02875 [Burkholderiales bacterium]|nr:MAG: hypothetical protein EON93_02875 [Burkholderiales bacterium]
MHSVSSEHACLAAITLVESLLIHMQETGVFDEGDRDYIYEVAIRSHLKADPEDSAHQAIAALLRVLHRRSDGVSIVGDLPDN